MIQTQLALAAVKTFAEVVARFQCSVKKRDVLNVGALSSFAVRSVAVPALNTEHSMSVLDHNQHDISLHSSHDVGKIYYYDRRCTCIVLSNSDIFLSFYFCGYMCPVCIGHFILFLFLIVKSLYTDIYYYIIDLISPSIHVNHTYWLAQCLSPVYSSIQQQYYPP